jgi:hypothetical protein
VMHVATWRWSAPSPSCSMENYCATCGA